MSVLYCWNIRLEQTNFLNKFFHPLKKRHVRKACIIVHMKLVVKYTNIRENISSILPLILRIWLPSVLKWFSIYRQEWFRSRFSLHSSTILAPLSQPIKIHHDFRAQDFPRLVTGSMHFLWILIGSKNSLFLLWLARCVVRHNAENRLINDECQLKSLCYLTNTQNIYDDISFRYMEFSKCGEKLS